MNRRLIFHACLALLPASLALAQQGRIGVARDQRSIVLKGSLNPKASAGDDRGLVEDAHRITGMTLVLKQSPAQEVAFAQLLQDQQTPGSSDYHKWITPDQYADRFGLSVADLAHMVSWLKSQGFSVDYQARGRNWMMFSGTAHQVATAFHTSMHYFQVDGQLHFSAIGEPSIPAALEPFVLAIRGLDDFRLEPPKRTFKPLTGPDYNSSNGTHNLAPGDLGVIYDINKLYSQNVNGAGQNLVVVGQTDIYLTDVQSFRSMFNLPVNNPVLVQVPNSADPGYTADLDEANLDLDWAGAIARNATISYVYSPNVITSLQYAIDQNIAPVISMSYGGCELKISSSPASTASAYRTLAQQAVAEGITWLAATGDSGAAGCDASGSVMASGGLSVWMPASIPEVTGVGGTTFNEGVTNYWSTTTGANGATALSYIPENAWNDTLANNGLSSSGGGGSVFYTKPSWQSAPGVPADGARDVPDLALAASADHDGYLVVINGKVAVYGGTSAATPVFAGIVTLLNHYLTLNGAQTAAGLGNINPTLYGLARNNPSVFHDVTLGSNIVPCKVGTLNCSTGTLGYSTGPGYDRVTGLGSVDAYNLATAWTGQPTNGTTTTLTANPTSLPITSSVALTATVKASAGTPTGSVSFSVGTITLGNVNLSASGVASITVFGSQLSTGTNTIIASYGGSTGFNGSSGSVVVTITVPSGASAVVPSVTPNPVYQQPPDSNGYTFFFTVSLNEIAGTATTLTDFTFLGTDYAGSITSFFGTASIPANGKISAALGASVPTVPTNGVLGFSGRDSSGATWTQQITVQFLPAQQSAAMVLTSSPATEVQNPTYDPSCTPSHPFFQQLDLQEQNGYEVQLTRFLAGGSDLSANIPDWFGSWRLAPLGSLQAGICWSTNALPTTLNYELDGTDTNGNTVTVTASTPFQGPAQNPGALSTSQQSVNLSAGAGQTVTNNQLSVNVSAGQQWSLLVFPNNQTTKWLNIYPLSGTGPTQLFLTAYASGLANGAYTATLVFQSVNTVPQFINVPVTFVIGASSFISINQIGNAASYEAYGAPGMLMYVGGGGLSASSQLQIASNVPLPYSIGGVSATVNGIPAPIYYVLNSQIVIQVPYETPSGTALLAVNENGRVATYSFYVYPSTPGIFVDSNNQLVPTGTAKRGSSLAFFITGEGDVTGGLATGSAPSTSIPVNQLPAPRGQFSMTVGGLSVTPLFVGIPYGLVGVTQVNFTVPANAPTGLQNVVVNMGGYKSIAAKLNITP